MAIPAYMWLKDDGGAEIKGSVDVNGRKIALKLLNLNTVFAFLLMPILVN